MICMDLKRGEIDSAILSGSSMAEVSRIYALSYEAVRRHVNHGHLARVLVKADETKNTVRANSLIDLVKDLRERTIRILEDSEKQKQHPVSLLALRELRNQLELLLKAAVLRRENSAGATRYGEMIEAGAMIYLKNHFPDAHAALIKYLVEKYEQEQRGSTECLEDFDLGFEVGLPFDIKIDKGAG